MTFLLKIDAKTKLKFFLRMIALSFISLLFSACAVKKSHDLSCLERCDYQNQLCIEAVNQDYSPSAKEHIWTCEKKREICKKRCKI